MGRGGQRLKSLVDGSTTSGAMPSGQGQKQKAQEAASSKAGTPPAPSDKHVSGGGGSETGNGDAAMTNALLREMMASHAQLATQVSELQQAVHRITVRINHATG